MSCQAEAKEDTQQSGSRGAKDGAHGVESRGRWVQAQLNPTNQWQWNLGYGLEVPNLSQLQVRNHWRSQTYMGICCVSWASNVTFEWESGRSVDADAFTLPERRVYRETARMRLLLETVTNRQQSWLAEGGAKK